MSEKAMIGKLRFLMRVNISTWLTGKYRAHHGEILREATRLAEAGRLVPRLDIRRFDLHSADLAYEALTDGTARGKIVVDVSL